MHNINDAIVINAKCINNIKCADETIIMARDLDGLQRLMIWFVHATKSVVLTVKNDPIQRVKSPT